jgi:hypothetical protein
VKGGSQQATIVIEGLLHVLRWLLAFGLWPVFSEQAIDYDNGNVTAAAKPTQPLAGLHNRSKRRPTVQCRGPAGIDVDFVIVAHSGHAQDH